MRNVLFLMLILLPMVLGSGPAPIVGELDGERVDPADAAVPYHYARINAADYEIAGMYYDPMAASKGEKPVDELPFGNLRYLSYTERTVIDGSDYVKGKHGMWMRASPAEIPLRANGITFSQTPDVDFGWVLKDTHPSPFAGVIPEPELGKWVQGSILVYDEVEEHYGTKWYRVAPNRWIDGFSFHPVNREARPPFKTEGIRWIRVDLTAQILTAYEGDEMVFAALIAGGAEDFTRPGVFAIERKLPAEDMYGALKADRSDYFYVEDVPYTMYFDGERAIHGIYWPATLGFPQSHGCINMTIGDAHRIYEWADVGDTVWVVE